MGKGFGIAALICAIIAIPIPVFGFYISAIALVLATIAAFGDDKVFAPAASLIVGVNTFFMSPLLWGIIAANNFRGGFVAIVLAAVAIPFAAIVVRSTMVGQGATRNPAAPPDYRGQSAPQAANGTAKSWREDEWWHPPEEKPVVKPAPPPEQPVDASVRASREDAFASIAKDAAARFKGGMSYRPKIPSASLRYVPPPQVLLFILLIAAVGVFVPETRDFVQNIAAGFMTAMRIVFGRYGAILSETALLLALAALFYKYGKRTWMVGVAACLVMIGYLAQKDFDWLTALKPRSSEGEQASVVAAKEAVRETVVDAPTTTQQEAAAVGLVINATDTQQTYNLVLGKNYLIQRDDGHRVHVHVVDGSIRLMYVGVDRPLKCSEDDQDFGPYQDALVYMFPCHGDATVMVSAGLLE